MSIDKLKPHDLHCNIFSVYDYDGYTIQELLCTFFEKINNCIDVSNATFELAKWLVNEGLNQEVVKQLMIWLQDGTLKEIINEQIFNDLNDKINDINTDLTSKINDLDNKLTDKIGNIVTADNSDFNSLQEAHDYVVSKGGGVLNISKDETLTRTFNWDVRKVIINGNGHILEYINANNDSFAIQTISSEDWTHPFRQSTISMNKLKIHANKCNGIMLSGLTSAKAVSHIKINDCEISDCNTGLTFGNNSYLISFSGCDIYDCNRICYFPESVTNAGENINFINCTLYNSLAGFEIYGGSCDFFFTQCSFDYNEVGYVFYIDNSKIFINNSHFEHNLTKFGTKPPFKVIGDSGLLSINNSLMLFTGYQNSQVDGIFNTTGGYSKVSLTNSFLFGLKTREGWLCSGTGNLVCKNNLVNIVPECDLKISPSTTQCAIGSMLNNELVDIFITEDSTPITNVSTSGTNLDITYDNTTTYKYNKSVKINKKTGAGTPSAIAFFAPIDRDSINNIEVVLKKTTGSGTAYISFGYCNKDGHKMYRDDKGTETKTYSSGETSWEKISKFYGKSPSWATHMFCYISISSMSETNMFIGEVTANSF